MAFCSRLKMCCIICCRNDSGDHSDHMHYYQVGFSSWGALCQNPQVTQRGILNFLQWVSVKVKNYQKFYNVNEPFCDRVKSISEIGEEEAEIQIGLQIRIDKDNSVSHLFYFCCCFWLNYALIEVFVVTKLARDTVDQGCSFREGTIYSSAPVWVGQPHSWVLSEFPARASLDRD